VQWEHLLALEYGARWPPQTASARSQQAVYTLQAAGAVTLPPVEFVWWDLTQRRRRVSRLDGLTLQVLPAVQRADPFAVAPAPAPACVALGRHRFGPEHALASAPSAGWSGDTLLRAVRRLRRTAAAVRVPDALPTLHP